MIPDLMLISVGARLSGQNLVRRLRRVDTGIGESGFSDERI